MRPILLLLLAAPLAAADTPQLFPSVVAVPKSAADGPPAKAKLAFPAVTPSAQPPSPAPIPGAVPILTADVQYVIPSDEPFLLLASPAGLVTVTREAGPIKVRGKFLDGSGKVETRTYQSKHVAIVEPVAGAKGRVELIAVPVGATEEGQAVRMLIDLNQGAQPPPVDPRPVDPVVSSFRVIWIHESGGTDKAHQTANTVANAKLVRDYLDANTTKDGADSGWRRWDKDQTAATDHPVFRELWTAVKPQVTVVPCVAIEVNGKVSIEPQPQTPQAALALFKKFTGK